MNKKVNFEGRKNLCQTCESDFSLAFNMVSAKGLLIKACLIRFSRETWLSLGALSPKNLDVYELISDKIPKT
jgi:hypothetical protein